MASFVPGTEINTDTPTVEVTASPDRPLPLGRQLFRLVVVDDSGNASQPTQVVVLVADQAAPNAVLRAPGIVPFGASFNLDGSASFDTGGGKIVTWLWTYMGPA